jgi:hypothetical protein
MTHQLDDRDKAKQFEGKQVKKREPEIGSL